MDVEKAEEIIQMYGTISDGNCITVLQNDKSWCNNPMFWDAANWLMQNEDYGFKVQK